MDLKEWVWYGLVVDNRFYFSRRYNLGNFPLIRPKQ